MRNQNLKLRIQFESNERCTFCHTNFSNSVIYGPIYQYEDIITHYFCLLLSSNIMQNGKDKEGILGFLPDDIKKEVVRGRRLTCTYCRKKGATIGCAVRYCRAKFHLPCGLLHKAQNLFYDNFCSFCCKHRTLQYIPLSKRNSLGRCLICLDSVTLSFTDIVWSPCCQSAWYHKLCIQEVAINSGYYFRCPNCNENKLFRKSMLELGIYIPDQDASWELVPNAYSNLNERYNHCDAETCLCPKGRDVSQHEGIWHIILCYRCLRKGIHKKCGKDLIFDDQWMCSNSNCMDENFDDLRSKTQCQTVSSVIRPSIVSTNSLLFSHVIVENKENSDPNSKKSTSIKRQRNSNPKKNSSKNKKRMRLLRTNPVDQKFKRNIKHYTRRSRLGTSGCKVCNTEEYSSKFCATKNTKNHLKIIGKRRKYIIDDVVVRVYPSVKKELKNIRIVVHS